MKLIITGGGTAGHINPALAIANEIRDRHPDWEIIYVGNSKHMEYNLVKRAGFKFVGMNVKGFNRNIKSISNIVNNTKAVGLLLMSNFKAKKILKEYKPDIVIGTGGYITGPIINAAANKGIKTVTHEQNAYPGVTTKILSRKVDKVLLAVEEAKKYLDKSCDINVVGNPIRKEILLSNGDISRNKLGIRKDQIFILSFGGSLGAQRINEAIANLISYNYKDESIYHIHATGKYGIDLFSSLLKKKGIDINDNPNIDIREYIDNMDECLSAADLVICRAGAITLSELEAVGKPSILIPSPNVAENHQYYNARVLSDAGAAILIEEKDLIDDKVYDEIKLLMYDKEKLRFMGDNAKKKAVTNSNEVICDIIEKLLKTKREFN